MNERQRAGAGRGARVAAECYFLAALSLSRSVSESRPVSFVGSPAAGRHKQGSAADQYCQPAPTHPLTAAVENTSGRVGGRAVCSQRTRTRAHGESKPCAHSLKATLSRCSMQLELHRKRILREIAFHSSALSRIPFVVDEITISLFFVDVPKLLAAACIKEEDFCASHGVVTTICHCVGGCGWMSGFRAALTRTG
jgi:hypothetical protein